MGRPKSEKYNIDDMIKIIEEYTDSTELPILKEVCYLNKWNYVYISELQRNNEDLSLCIKTLLDKKETELEKGGLTGKYSQTMTIFSLKQLGWKDIIDTNTTNTQKIVIVNDLENE